MNMFGYDGVLVELWPSLAEIQESEESNEYKGRLTEFYDSIDSLMQSLRLSNLPARAFTDNHLKRGEPASRMHPPEIVEIVACIGSGGAALALAFYKILKLWVDFKNGRRIKVVDGGMEIEATQLTPEQFMELIELLTEKRKTLAARAELRDELDQKGMPVSSVDSEERYEARRVLSRAAWHRTDKSDA